jgi:RNA polymerase sigma-70 factor (ECF subfamily)
MKMGKRQRFEQLVQSHSTEMFRYALWLCGNREVAEDLVQEAFTRAWNNLHQLREPGKEKAWLMTIVRNENARRFQRVQPDLVDIEEHAWSMSADTHLEPEQQMERRILREAMLELEEEYREPLIMQVIHGFSCREIAEALELTENAVMTRLFRAKQKVKTALTESSAAAVARL